MDVTVGTSPYGNNIDQGYLWTGCCGEYLDLGSAAHPASYPIGTGGSFPGGAAAEAWRWPLSSL